MNNTLHAGPWHNPVLPEGIYDAEIRSVTQATYGSHHYPVVQIRLWLPQCGQCILTNLFFPSGASVKSQQRLWYFTNMVGLQPNDIVEDRKSFEGKLLRVELRTACPHGTSYSDVHRFLPAVQVAPSACPPVSKVKQYAPVEYAD
jgi:hypothetical protein